MVKLKEIYVMLVLYTNYNCLSMYIGTRRRNMVYILYRYMQRCATLYMYLTVTLYLYLCVVGYLIIKNPELMLSPHEYTMETSQNTMPIVFLVSISSPFPCPTLIVGNSSVRDITPGPGLYIV